MGLAIFVFILGLVVAILLTPALQARARKRRDELKDTVHEAVVRRLDDRRRGGPKGPGAAPKDEPGDDAKKD